MRKTAGDVGGAALSVHTAPFQVIAGTARVVTSGAPPSEIIQPYVTVYQRSGNGVRSLIEMQALMQSEITQEAQRAAAVAGRPGEVLFDAAAFGPRYLSNLATAGGMAVVGAVLGENPLNLAAAPLAAALRAAEEQHKPGSRPIPDEIKAKLAPYFAAETLANARCTTGKLEISVPNLIGKATIMFSEPKDYKAVVAGDVIVFPDTIPSARRLEWWAHELTHVEQYRRWGFEKFAYYYARTGGKQVEREAEVNGARIFALLEGRPVPPQRPTSPARISMLSDTPIVNSATAVEEVVVSQPDSPMTVIRDSLKPPGQGEGQAEYPVWRCYFPRDLSPVFYLVTNKGRIFAYDPFSGLNLQIGWAVPSRVPGAAWWYCTPNFSYPVDATGTILWIDQFGRPWPGGTAQKLLDE